MGDFNSILHYEEKIGVLQLPGLKLLTFENMLMHVICWSTHIKGINTHGVIEGLIKECFLKLTGFLLIAFG